MKEDSEAKILICSECKEEFVFTLQAQEYFLEKGYLENPKRCKTCHTSYKKSQRDHKVHQPEPEPEKVGSEYPE